MSSFPCDPVPSATVASLLPRSLTTIRLLPSSGAASFLLSETSQTSVSHRGRQRPAPEPLSTAAIAREARLHRRRSSGSREASPSPAAQNHLEDFCRRVPTATHHQMCSDSLQGSDRGPRDRLGDSPPLSSLLKWGFSIRIPKTIRSRAASASCAATAGESLPAPPTSPSATSAARPGSWSSTATPPSPTPASAAWSAATSHPPLPPDRSATAAPSSRIKSRPDRRLPPNPLPAADDRGSASFLFACAPSHGEPSPATGPWN